jgi:MFS family permease
MRPAQQPQQKQSPQKQPPPRRRPPPGNRQGWEPPPRTRAPRGDTYGEAYPETYGEDYGHTQHVPAGYAGGSRFYSDDPDATERIQGTPPSLPRKLTVTRVAAWRSRNFSKQAVSLFNRAARADGAWESGLTALTYVVMLSWAVMASMSVALANTLFFSAATSESKGKVALYLLITIAPFALIAPVVGPLLDRIQRGRRIAMAGCCAAQAVLFIVMALHFDDWLLYPAALGVMVMSKSIDVLKAAVAPRVLPSGITLSTTNARLMTFAMAAGGAFGAVAAGLAWIFGSPGALWFAMLLGIANAVLCLRLPSRVEVTEGEVPASLSLRIDTTKLATGKPAKRRQPMGRQVIVALWGTSSIRMFTGFMMLFPAFVIKAETQGGGFQQLLLLGLVGAGAGGGSFLGNAIGSRRQFGKPDQIVLGCLGASLAGAVLAAITDSVVTAAIAALLGGLASSLAKNNLDSVIQDDMPEASRASAFSRSETLLQMAWVFGGAVGVLLPAQFWLGFTVIAALLALGLGQTMLSQRGGSLIPGLGGDRPIRPDQPPPGPPPGSPLPRRDRAQQPSAQPPPAQQPPAEKPRQGRPAPAATRRWPGS